MRSECVVCGGREFGQERVAVVEAGDDERLDQDLCCFTHDEGPDPAYVVESDSTRLGHRGDALQDSWAFSTTPRFLTVGAGGYFDVLNGDK